MDTRTLVVIIAFDASCIAADQAANCHGALGNENACKSRELRERNLEEVIDYILFSPSPVQQ